MLFSHILQKINISKMFFFFQENVSDDNNIATTDINCFKHSYICSKYNLIPGSISISYPPHSENFHSFPIKLNNEGISLRLQEIFEAAQKKPLFLLVARPNAGDLEYKLPMIRELAIKLVHKDITFGIVTVPYIYEQFANYPLTAFVSIKAIPPLSLSSFKNNNEPYSFISKKMEHITFHGDFTIESLINFVFNNAQVVWGPRRITSKIGIAYVGRNLSKDVYESLIPYITNYPLIFENITSSPFILSGICHSVENECLAVVDYKSYRSIVIPLNESFNSEIILNTISNFEQLWKEQSFIKRLKGRLYLFISTNISAFLAIGILLSVVIFGISFIHNDKTVQYYDERMAQNKRKLQ